MVFRPTRDPRVGSAPPRFATVGVTSAVVVPTNTARRRLILVNDSDTVIYLARGFDAVLNAGIRLNAQGGNLIEEMDNWGYIYVGPWYAISSAAAKNLTISEE